MATEAHTRLQDIMSRRPVILAPMEDVSDGVFRALCRTLGAELCVTEFVNAEGLLRGCRTAKRKITLAPDDRPTAIQIYGSDASRLAEAMMIRAQFGAGLAGGAGAAGAGLPAAEVLQLITQTS